MKRKIKTSHKGYKSAARLKFLRDKKEKGMITEKEYEEAKRKLK